MIDEKVNGNGRIQINFSEDGTLQLLLNQKMLISRSPIGMVVCDNTLYAPYSAVISDSRITLHYEVCDVVLSVGYRENGSCRLEVKEIPDDIERFVFGPYQCPGAVSCGEELGAAWFTDDSLACIQSLNPKTVGGYAIIRVNGYEQYPVNNTVFPTPYTRAAGLDRTKGTALLQCTASNMSQRMIRDYEKMKNAVVEPVEGEDGQIAGAAIILTAAENAGQLLEDICTLEVEEGLPHPTIDGEWAKTSPKANEIYFVMSDTISREEQLAIAERAGVHCVYYGDIFQSWGHFEINRQLYPGGEEELAAFVKEAGARGIKVGFHTLSNFIHTHDAYVTPVPHPELLVMDQTVLTDDIGKEDTVLHIADINNFETKSPVQAIRLEDELIHYDAFDRETMCLTGCERGAFGTIATSHRKETVVSRLWDHDFRTLFPTIRLQGDLAERVGTVIRDAGIRRFSFDGIEGCTYTGLGEYASSEYVRRVFEVVGTELTCDASGFSHYRWHAHTYGNWGEPWYEDDHRGGMYNRRATAQKYFKRNLIPGMLGWYVIWEQCERFEATTPEIMEYILSRTVAFDAGMCIKIRGTENGNLNQYLDLIRLWSEFRQTVRVPEEIRKLMREERSDWHLEKTDSRWILSEMTVKKQTLNYCDEQSFSESGFTGYQSGSTEFEGGVLHESMLVVDLSSPDPEEIPFVDEPFHCRIRVGTPLDQGEFYGLDFYSGWGGVDNLLGFQVKALPGDYLEYDGGTVLKHCDGNFHLIEIIQGQGEELMVKGSGLYGLTPHYALTNDDMEIAITIIRTKQRFEFPVI